jgi:transposase InsO family protein
VQQPRGPGALRALINYNVFVLRLVSVQVRRQVRRQSLSNNQSDNATAETFWSTLKTEFNNRRRWHTKPEARLAVGA